ncbi:MAG: methyltransferase family protein [Desulfomonilaceae bacterium]
MVSEYLIKWGVTGFIWSAWCVLHSMLNSEGPIRKSGLLDSSIGPYYRLTYSVLAAITLLLAYWVTPKWQGFQLWRIEGPALVLQVLAWSVVAVMFYLTFKIFSIWYFLGLTILGIGRKTNNSQKRLITWGIYRLIRHPQSAAGLIILWMRDLTDTGLIINIVLSVYLMVGARIEETRFLAMYGNEYAEYMEKVPRFVPNTIPSIQALFRGRSAS